MLDAGPKKLPNLGAACVQWLMRFVALALLALVVACHGWSSSDRRERPPGPPNTCVAWYLAGGAEAAIYIQYAEPTFCGCLENTCNWFTQ